MNTAADAAAQLQDALLRETVEWCAAKSPYYRATFGKATEAFRGLVDLARLPVLTRADIVAHHADIQCDPSLPAALQHTTGTTGAFLQIHRGQAEQAFVWDFFAGQLEANPRTGLRPLYLNLVNAYHGALTGMPSHAYVLSAGVHDRAQAQQARGLLERTYDLPGVEARVSMVMGTERMVKALTAYLIHDGFDLQGSSVRTVTLFGGHVTPARKQLLGQLWGATVGDRYSLTEMFGGAVECGHGGPWVFDPHVVPEVVHPRTLQTIDHGVGVLLLTSLYPFTQQMPLVRYFTGDLVEVVEPASAPGGLQARYLGRLTRSVIDASGAAVQPLLLSGPLYEILEAVPDLAITPRFTDLAAGLGLELTGDLHYSVDTSRPEGAGQHAAPSAIHLRLGLRYAPWMFTDRVVDLVQQLTRQLWSRHPELATRCADGRLTLRIDALEGSAVAPYDSK